MRYLAVALLAMGCLTPRGNLADSGNKPPPFVKGAMYELPTKFKHTCPDVPCFKLVGSDEELDCAIVSADIAITLWAYDHYRPMPPGFYYRPYASAAVCPRLSTVTLRIRSETKGWKHPHYPYPVSGMYYFTDYIEITRDMDALAHETLHAMEAGTLGINVGERPGDWDENVSYLEFLDGYESTALPLDLIEP